MITTTQAVQSLTDEDTAAMMLWEKKIDAALCLYEDRPILVDFNGSGVRRKVMEKLCQKYREAGGWLAQIKTGDQRDPGPWIEFAIPSPPRSGPGQR